MPQVNTLKGETQNLRAHPELINEPIH